MPRIEPLHPLFAGRVTGLDLRRAATDREVATIRDALARLSVLVFPDQPIDDAAQIAFSARLGPLEATRGGAKGAGSPVIVLTNIGPDGTIAPPTDKQALNNRANSHWHADSSFKPVPAAASMLSAREVPGDGGDTQWASLRAAWDALPEALQRAARGRVAIHDFAWSRGRIDPTLVTEAERADWPPVRQALVLERPHGPSLYLGAHARSIEGMDEAAGRALLDELTAFATQDRFVLTHRWAAGDLVLWDNRAVLHRATPFASNSARRHMVRTTIAGEAPTLG